MITGRVSADNICTRLHRAYRGLRLYPADHPSARLTIDALVEALTSHVDALGPLVLDVEETRLLCEDDEVYSFAESRDNLAFLMFRDGIRSLSFHPGLDAGEVSAFVDCLAHADDLADVEHDLATAFWEQDFFHIDYRVADPFLGGEVLREGTIDALRETVLRRLEEVAPADMQATDLPGVGLLTVERVDLDPGNLILTQAEIEQSERTVADSSRALEDFALVLLEIAGDPTTSSDDDTALAGALALVLDRYLESGDLDECGLLLDRLQGLEERGRRAAGFVDSVVGEAVTPQRLGAQLEGIGQATAEEAARIEAFLGTIRPRALPALLGLLVESNDKAVRKTVLAALHMQDGISGVHVWPLMEDLRWYVVRNAVQLMTGSSDPELPGRLEKLLRHPDARVRREVVRTLDTLEGTRPVPALLRALDDEDSSVRALAARSLGRHGGHEHHATVLARLESRSFDTRPAEEVEAFLLALAALGGGKAVAVLDRFWRRRHLRARPLPVRLAALQALGTIASSEAERILKEAAGSREAQVRRVAARALHEGQARRAKQ